MKIRLTLLIIIWCSLNCLSQHNAELTNALKKELSKNSTKDGKWVFNENEAEIYKIEKKIFAKYFPDTELYQVKLTNYLGYHINTSNCLVLFYRSKGKIQLVEPIWYSDIDKKFLKKFIGLELKDKNTLHHLIFELQDLMMIGSNYTTNNTKITDSNITFDVIKKSSKNKVWRKIKIKIKAYSIIGFSSTNPKLNETKTVE